MGPIVYVLLATVIVSEFFYIIRSYKELQEYRRQMREVALETENYRHELRQLALLLKARKESPEQEKDK